ncbi:GATA transcription factor 19-like [Juglans microcarpa x Juglans regia]|uniref:GATA transcription factor 19-like n=1 Tax=Juglans microcarpa x Juglans regia TaxID=2249226 RepID=UPI001B7DD797|nr:GATA transcription factor 19-like [Juglans microcarpa x Juglans regia]
MHHCCSSQEGNMGGQCSCGLFHSQSNSFSMLFSNPNQYRPYDESEMYSFTSSSSPSVDCTLSLGTPSTRLTEDDHEKRRRSSSSVSNFCWDMLQTKHTPSAPQTHKTSRGGNNGSNHNSANDPLFARRCANCDTTSTPLWRNGPRGPKSLCNACGIRFKKEERRATSAASTATNNGGSSGGPMEPEYMFSHHNNSWYAHSQTQKLPCFAPAIGNEFRFIEDNDRDSDTGIPPFLSWRLNVTDRPSLVHDFT